VDPNLDPTKLADTSTYGATVRGNLLAGTPADDDPFRAFVGSRSLAAGSAGKGVYGENFLASPGYNFTVEEMQREQDRKNSAGGNYGGRALMEATRRAEGVAAQEYYNWAAGRERDLGRAGAAEATDIARGDSAYTNYLERKAGDASRLDSASMYEDKLAAGDLERSDQGYYNYLAAIRAQAGFGAGPAATAVNASERAGSSVANAYGAQGDALAGTYGDLGVTNANIAYAQGAGINNALQSGASNFVTAKNA
jgi:hypothetical protein